MVVPVACYECIGSTLGTASALRVFLLQRVLMRCTDGVLRVGLSCFGRPPAKQKAKSIQ